MTYLFPQDLVLREPSFKFEPCGYDIVFANRSTKAYGEACDELSRVVRRFETALYGALFRGQSKKDIPMLGPLGFVTNSHWASANGQERYLFKELKCYGRSIS